MYVVCTVAVFRVKLLTTIITYIESDLTRTLDYLVVLIVQSDSDDLFVCLFVCTALFFLSPLPIICLLHISLYKFSVLCCINGGI